MLKYTLTGFADEISPDLDVQMSVLDSLNIRHIEMRGVDRKNLCDYTVEDAKKIKERLDARGFKLSAIGSPLGKIKITDPFEPHFEFFKHVCDLADLFETKRIRIFSYYIDEGDDPAKYRDEVLRRTEIFVKEAQVRGILLQHENEKGIYGDNAERCLDLQQNFYGDNFKCVFDPANFVQCKVETYPHAFGLLKDYITYMHIKDAHMDDGVVTVAGRGDGHVKEILTELSERNYEGFLSLEPHLHTFVGFSDLEVGATNKATEDAGLGGKLWTAAVTSLRGILDEIGAVNAEA
ncbi:MAG: sugar phosphate isomerase/epimerase [Firmicutes bacterium]|nr:sugar phosphate isomerase/epimerase [Bacillota bacterium]